MDTIIDVQFKENKELLEFLEKQNEISFLNDMNNKLKKILLLSGASYFEKEISDIVVNYIEKKTEGNDLIVSFVKNKAVSRQYHTYFDWKGKNVNRFFSLFGSEFKVEAENEIKEEKLEDSVKAFLELGELRNNLVHQNTGTYVIDKTTEEIYELYRNALKFLEFLRKKLC